MPKPLCSPLLLWILPAALLSGCGTTSPATRAWESATWGESSTCEAPDADQCVVLACDGEEGICGVFSCEDVDPEAVAQVSLAHGAELARGGAYRSPTRGPGPSRNWRNTGVRQGTRPRVTFHFRYRFGYLPAFPRYDGKVVKHHLFPQAREFREWFREAGLNPHQYTLLIPEHIHREIHRGDGRGGLWNAEWREYVKANPRPPKPEVLLRHALDLAFRYKLVGPIVPYNHPVVPIGPQLFQN
jgi:uncharacterized lipoprotein (TIGR02269 family)